MQDDLGRVATHQDKDEEEVLKQKMYCLKKYIFSYPNLILNFSHSEQKKSEFLPAILDVVSRINDCFSRYFASMRCAGEVMLNTGDYGIKMRVQYRSEEPLIELSANLHSDGEISLATALYLLAMQEISHVPFCCIDEINQVR